MKIVIVVFLSCSVGYLLALKCEFDKTNGDKVKHALSQCANSNETEILWKMALDDESDEEDSSEEDDQSTNQNSNATTSKSKRAADKQTITTKMGNNAEMTESNSNNGSPGTDTENVSENCIIQCVLSNLDMVDANGKPDHSKLIEGLLETATARELRNFLQDTVDQCYREVSDDNNLDNCALSTKLVRCLVEKGKASCSDWPAGALPF